MMLRLEEKTGLWYDGVQFQNAHLVTDKNFNPALGISGIILDQPNSHGRKGNVFASVTILFENGLSVFGTLYVQSDNQGLYFKVDQRKYTDANGQDAWTNYNVSVPSAIQAQVIRHAMTRAKEVAIKRTGAPKQRPAQNQQPAQNQAPQQTYTQAPPAPTAPADEDFNDFGLMDQSFDVENIDFN